jgi:hypothetical protein
MKIKSLNFAKLPLLVSLLIVAIVLNCIKNDKVWKQDGGVIKWDIISYYAYLPATFIYKDHKLTFIENYKGQHKFVFWPRKAPNGANVILTSMGMAMLYSPFFFAGDAAAHFTGFDTGGFSPPYSLALILSAVFYFAVGLYFLSKLLMKFFSPLISSFVLVVIVFGTNLFYYVTYYSAMTHPYSFALITMFTWYTIKWHENRKTKYAIILGLLMGIITLIRPTNIVFALFFAFWNVKSFHELWERISLILSEYRTILVIGIFAFLVWVPQLLYWKSLTGTFFYDSYGEENSFFFTHPRILKGIFGYRHGWLIYSPAMIFSLIGMFFLWKINRQMLVPVVLTFLVFIYVIFSWWCWWYGGAFGLRTMIDIYGLLALPLAAFFTYSLEWKKVWRWASVAVCIVLIAASLHHTDKFRHFSMHWDSNTKESFWDSYLNRRPSPTQAAKFRTPDYELARKGIDALVEDTGQPAK